MSGPVQGERAEALGVKGDLVGAVLGVLGIAGEKQCPLGPSHFETYCFLATSPQ